MTRLVVFAVLAVVVWKMATGRWPWQPNVSTRAQALFRARKLLGVRADAHRGDIIEAHKRLIAIVHPDRGGTNDQVHEANAARDLLLDELPDPVTETR
ncbi:molecular chaperone DnaJ [Altererythrobacter salegens]|uniref:Molecular chaperone DnaJ n=1 Tax=Croceibacterium salegens TaxID=1737568 RepID=A0A6I4SWE6_9SPHN|nr:molecular chaperone DnaJ [Croceibacterium salegens]MXO60345.1 molecular chaperone DnaJ [Croceibacterium salegens]